LIDGPVFGSLWLLGQYSVDSKKQPSLPVIQAYFTFYPIPITD